MCREGVGRSGLNALLERVWNTSLEVVKPGCGKAGGGRDKGSTEVWLGRIPNGSSALVGVSDMVAVSLAVANATSVATVTSEESSIWGLGVIPKGSWASGSMPKRSSDLLAVSKGFSRLAGNPKGSSASAPIPKVSSALTGILNRPSSVAGFKDLCAALGTYLCGPIQSGEGREKQSMVCWN